MISLDPKTIVVSSLATDSFVAVSKKALRYFKGDAILALVLCELVAIYKYQLEHRNVDPFGYFPLPIAFMEKSLSLSSFKQQHSLQRLQADNLLTVTIMGKPTCRYVSLNFEAISKILLDTEVDASQPFYSNLSQAASKTDFNSDSEFLGNIKDPLRNCIVEVSRRIRDTKSAVVWSSEAVGILRSVVRSLHKHQNFDYGQFIDICNVCQIKTQEARHFVYELKDKWKRVAERDPSRRIYNYADI